MQAHETPAALRRTHKAALQPLDRYQELLLALIRITCADLEENEPEAWSASTFPAASGLLANKCLSHAESIRALTAIGRYGDALMCSFLREYQDRIPAWFDYANQRNVVSKRERLKLERKFSDVAVRRGLEAKGMRMQSVGKQFGMYSEAAHGSSWGAIFFGRRESKSGYTILPHGHFHNFTANVLSIQTIFYLDRILLNAIFVWLDRAQLPWTERLLRRYVRLGDDLDGLYADHGNYLDRLFSEMAD